MWEPEPTRDVALDRPVVPKEAGSLNARFGAKVRHRARDPEKHRDGTTGRKGVRVARKAAPQAPRERSPMKIEGSEVHALVGRLEALERRLGSDAGTPGHEHVPEQL